MHATIRVGKCACSSFRCTPHAKKFFTTLPSRTCTFKWRNRSSSDDKRRGKFARLRFRADPPRSFQQARSAAALRLLLPRRRRNAAPVVLRKLRRVSPLRGLCAPDISPPPKIVSGYPLLAYALKDAALPRPGRSLHPGGAWPAFASPCNTHVLIGISPAARRPPHARLRPPTPAPGLPGKLPSGAKCEAGHRVV